MVNIKQNTTFYKSNEYSLYTEFWLIKLQEGNIHNKIYKL